jgi:phosphoribosylamine-glycine ligase
MISIMMYSKEGEGYEIAHRLAMEGNNVKIKFESDKCKWLGQGIRNPQRVTDSQNPDADLCLFSTVGLGRIAESLAKRGKVVLGGHRFADMIELDRGYGAKIAELMDVEQPESTECKNAKGVRQTLESVDYPCALKPFGNKSVTLTLLSKTPDNEYLKSVVEAMPEVFSQGCLVQKVVDGIEISTEGWFNGEDWVLPFNHTIEYKRLGEGDKGAQTGCMGNVIWTTDEDEMIKRMHLKLTGLLRKVGYVGPFDVNTIVTKDKIYFLEFTPRFGYDAIQTYTELLNIPLSEMLYRVATGTISRVPVKKDCIAFGVRLSVSPYPHGEDASFLKGVKPIRWIKEAAPHLWLSDVMWTDSGPCLAGVDGQIGCVTAWGVSLDEARRRVYRTVDNIVLTSDVQYRKDVGESAAHNVRQQWQQLYEWGYINAVKEREFKKGDTREHSGNNAQLGEKGNNRSLKPEVTEASPETSNSNSLTNSKEKEEIINA